MSRERPILFSAPMVQAVLAGRKTQTRREITKTNSTTGCWPWDTLRWDREPIYADGIGHENTFGQYLHVPVSPPECPDGIVDRVYSRIKPGDSLWVREAWVASGIHDALKPSQIDLDESLKYLADNTVSGVTLSDWGRYRHARFMCRWMSRITLSVTGVRCERSAEITIADLISEGAWELPGGCGAADLPSEIEIEAREAWRDLWDSVNGPGALEQNAWVWVYEFERRPR